MIVFQYSLNKHKDLFLQSYLAAAATPSHYKKIKDNIIYNVVAASGRIRYNKVIYSEQIFQKERNIMISLWFCNPGEDYTIEKFSKNMDIVTSDNQMFSLKALQGKTLSIINKDKDTIFAVFHGHRLAFKREFALMIQGTITGKTKEEPIVLQHPAKNCHCCKNCKGCCS